MFIPMIAKMKINRVQTINTFPNAGILLKRADTINFKPSLREIILRGRSPLNALRAFKALSLVLPLLPMARSNRLTLTMKKSNWFQPNSNYAPSFLSSVQITLNAIIFISISTMNTVVKKLSKKPRMSDSIPSGLSLGLSRTSSKLETRMQNIMKLLKLLSSLILLHLVRI